MFFEEILQHVMDPDADDYVPVEEIVGKEVVEFFALQASKKIPDEQAGENPVESILETVDHVYMSFPEPGEKRESFIKEDVPNLRPRNFQEDLEAAWDEILKSVMYGTIEKAKEGEDFPVIVDMFQVQTITFGYKVEDREKNLREVMDYLVEAEDYETAATVRDLLKNE